MSHSWFSTYDRQDFDLSGRQCQSTDTPVRQYDFPAIVDDGETSVQRSELRKPVTQPEVGSPHRHRSVDACHARFVTREVADNIQTDVFDSPGCHLLTDPGSRLANEPFRPDSVQPSDFHRTRGDRELGALDRPLWIKEQITAHTEPTTVHEGQADVLENKLLIRKRGADLESVERERRLVRGDLESAVAHACRQ